MIGPRVRTHEGLGCPWTTIGRALACALAITVTPGVFQGAEAQEAFTALEEIHGDDPEALELYREAREHLNRGEMAEAAALFREIHEEYPDATFAPRAEYYEAMARLRQGSEEQRERALEVLRAHVDHPESPETVDDARRLVEALGEGAGALEDAMEAVSLDETAMEECPENVRSVRAAAFHALSRRDPDETRQMAHDVALSEDPCDAELRSHAIWMLVRDADERDVEVLVSLVRDAEDEDARRQAGAALGRFAEDDGVFDVLLELAGDPDVDADTRQQVVHQALRALGSRDEEGAGRKLGDLYSAVEDDEDLIRAVVFSLSRIDHPEATAILMEAARSSDDPELQAHAIHALGNVDDPEVDALLRELLGRDP